MKKIWEILSNKEKKVFNLLLIFSLIILCLEIISIGSIFPVVYGITDPNFFNKYEIINRFILNYNLTGPQVSILILFFVFLIILIKNIILSAYYFFESKFIFGIQESLSAKLFSKLINMNYSFHLENNSADLITRIRSDSIIIRESIYALFNLIKSLIFVIGLLIFLAVIEPYGFFITAITFLTIGIIFYKFTSKKSEQIGEKRQEQEILRSKKLQEGFNGIKEIKTFLKNEAITKSYNELAKLIGKTYYIRSFISKIPFVFLETLTVLIIVILSSILIFETNNYAKIFALLGVFSVSAVKISPHLKMILNSLNIFKFSKLPIDFYYRKFDDNNRVNQDKNIAKNNLNFEKDIQFEKIFFKYPNSDENVLENINFTIKKGDKVIIKGETGSGKSTLIDLILGLQPPFNGKIKIDGREVNLQTSNWLSRVSYVPQDIFLFDDTVKNNIVLGEKNFDQDLFNKCLEAAEIKKFVKGLPKEENTLLGEDGSNISGGQKQRVGIARALYKNSDIIIFDEATNALDQSTEIKIFNNLAKEFDKTFLIINHREINSNFQLKTLVVENKNIIKK